MEGVTKVNRKIIYELIYECLDGAQLTARELAQEILRKTGMLDGTRQAVAPRLTELELMRKVEVVGTKIDQKTHKKVSIYAIKDEKTDSDGTDIGNQLGIPY